MNFKKLQEMQQALDNAILAEKPKMSDEELFTKTLVALSVELAEVANCSEHFKHWKINKGKLDNSKIFRDEDEYYLLSEITSNADGETFLGEELTREQAHHLTLVEEAADCLHFILSLANQLDYEIDFSLIKYFNYPLDVLYLSNQNKISDLAKRFDETGSYKALLSFYMSYVSNLGIAAHDLEKAYYDKNEVNYQRLRDGY